MINCHRLGDVYLACHNRDLDHNPLKCCAVIFDEVRGAFTKSGYAALPRQCKTNPTRIVEGHHFCKTHAKMAARL